MEHRQAQREPAEITVLLRTAEGITRKGLIKDVSTLGAGIVMANGTLPRGSIVDIRLSPSDTRQRSQRLRARGYVVRVHGSEFGLLWVTNDALSPIFQSRQKHDTARDNALLIA